ELSLCKWRKFTARLHAWRGSICRDRRSWKPLKGRHTQGFEGKREINLWLHTLPDLIAPIGRIIACDPFYCADTTPFTVETPTGQYPVILRMAHCLSAGDERIVAAMHRFADAPAVRWELAVCKEDDEQESSEGYTYCVDSGFASFMD